MVPVPGLSTLKAVLGGATFTKGMDYARRGQVHGVWWDADRPDLLRGEVWGSEPDPYEQQIAWSNERGRFSIAGDCSCPVGLNCKHVAAALIQASIRPPGNVPPGQESRRRTEPRRGVVPEARNPAALAPAVRARMSTGRDLALDQWLQRLQEARAAPGEPTARSADVLLFLLSAPLPGQRGVRVGTARVRRLKSGEYGVPQATPNIASSQAAFISDWDRRMARLIRAQQTPVYPDALMLEGDWGAELLPRLLASGRCHWQDAQAQPLREGAARSGQFRWALLANGSSTPVIDVPGIDIVLPLSPPMYVDARTHEVGTVDCGLPPALALQLLHAPALTPQQAPRVTAAWSQALGEWARTLPAPVLPRVEERRNLKPVPVLVLKQAVLEAGWAYAGPVDVAELMFDYDGARCPAVDPEVELTRVVEGVVVRVHRHAAFEKKAEGRLGQTGLVMARGPYGTRLPYRVPPPDQGPRGWIEFLAVHVPRLKAQGWRVEAAPEFRWTLHEPEEEWQAQIEEGRDWFDLALNVVVDGKPTRLLPLLVSLLQQARGKLDPVALKALPDDAPIIIRDEHDRLIRLDAGRLKPILGTLLELYDERPLGANGSLRLPRNAGLLLDGLGEKLRFAGGEALRELAARLRAVNGLEAVAAPAGLRCELRDYQRHGLSWLQFLRRMDLAGVLADDMGLGKTVQTLAHLLLEKEQGRLDRPALVIAPTSLMFNWRREAERFAPALRVLVLHGPDRRNDFDAIPRHDLVLSTYPLLTRDIEVLKQQAWHIVVLDEAQNIKNAHSKAAQNVAELDTRHRLALTGTPLENHLGELWSLFHFLMPGYLADERAFRRRFRTPIEKHGDLEVRSQLARRIARFLLRRTKGEVARELPPRTEIIRSVALEGAQRDLYETVREAMQEKVRREIEQRGLARSQIVVLDALLKLRQICCHPRLLKLESAKPVRQSAKLDLLMNLLPEMLAEGRRVLLFSQFTSMLALIEEELAAQKIPYLKLTGDTRDRQTLVDRFQKHEVALFLISLKAGGVGLNLTAADTVIHYDPWWNPAVENQATDRAHRIGQDKPVFVYKLYTENTVEEKIAALQASKRALADTLFGENATSALQLDGETLAGLFDPIGRGASK
ncbi:MAG: DEAD/DEAH box helicase [Panacagrimonas sp.]